MLTFDTTSRAQHQTYLVNTVLSRQSNTAPTSALRDSPTEISVISHEKHDVAREFQKLAKGWVSETQYVSSLTEKYLHPNYARIIGMGPDAIPLILKELERRPNDWFYALRAITGCNPVSDSCAGNMRQMSNAWLSWGRQKGFV